MFYENKKKKVHSSNLNLRFYESEGWSIELLYKYITNPTTTIYTSPDEPSIRYYVYEGTSVNIDELYENEVSSVHRQYDDYPYDTDLEFMKRMI